MSGISWLKAASGNVIQMASLLYRRGWAKTQARIYLLYFMQQSTGCSPSTASKIGNLLIHPPLSISVGREKPYLKWRSTCCTFWQAEAGGKGFRSSASISRKKADQRTQAFCELDLVWDNSTKKHQKKGGRASHASCWVRKQNTLMEAIEAKYLRYEKKKKMYKVNVLHFFNDKSSK